jgi:hypothetical protein
MTRSRTGRAAAASAIRYALSRRSRVRGPLDYRMGTFETLFFRNPSRQ